MVHVSVRFCSCRFQSRRATLRHSRGLRKQLRLRTLGSLEHWNVLQAIEALEDLPLGCSAGKQYPDDLGARGKWLPHEQDADRERVAQRNSRVSRKRVRLGSHGPLVEKALHLLRVRNGVEDVHVDGTEPDLVVEGDRLERLAGDARLGLEADAGQLLRECGACVEQIHLEALRAWRELPELFWAVEED